MAIRCAYGVPRAVFTGRDPFLKWEWKRGVVDKGGGGGGKSVGEEMERGGVPSEVDPARGPAHRVTGTQGAGRREPLQTTGMGHRALRGGKGGSRAFVRRLRNRGGNKGRRGRRGGHNRGTRRGRSRGCQTLGTR